MKFGTKSEPKKCSRCFRTKEEAIKEQKIKGAACTDRGCTFKAAILSALKQQGGNTLLWQHCPQCGSEYYKSYSRFCHHCGKPRE